MTDTQQEYMFSYICERDIDLLIVEELRCSVAFQEWFLRTTCEERLSEPLAGITSVSVHHSVLFTGKSLAIRLKAPQLDCIRPFNEQRKKVEHGLRSALRLREWFDDHHQDLREVASRLNQEEPDVT